MGDSFILSFIYSLPFLFISLGKILFWSRNNKAETENFYKNGSWSTSRNDVLLFRDKQCDHVWKDGEWYQCCLWLRVDSGTCPKEISRLRVWGNNLWLPQTCDWSPLDHRLKSWVMMAVLKISSPHGRSRRQSPRWQVDQTAPWCDDTTWPVSLCLSGWGDRSAKASCSSPPRRRFLSTMSWSVSQWTSGGSGYVSFNTIGSQKLLFPCDSYRGNWETGLKHA